MDAMQQTTVVAGQQSAVNVRLIADYTSTDDVTLRRGEECVMLSRHDNDWVLVSRGCDGRHVYVPSQYVELSDVDLDLDLERPVVSLTRASTIVSPSSPHLMTSWAGVVRSFSLRSSRKKSPPVIAMTTPLNGASCPSDSLDATAAVPPPPASFYSNTFPRRDVTNRYVVVKQTNDVGVQYDEDHLITEANHSPSITSQAVVDDSIIYANWDEIQRSRLFQTIPLPPRPTVSDHIASVSNGSSPHITVTSPGEKTMTSFESQVRTDSGDRQRMESTSSPSLETKIDDVFNATLLKKKGCLQCLPIRDNGKSIAPTQWTSSYVVLRGALISFYRDEAAAQSRSDGSLPLPIASLGLQGAMIQITSYDNPAFDAIRITTSCNTQYVLQAATVQETQSWCYHLKNNVAVLLAERTARMESATPVSTFSTSSKQRGKLFSTDGSSPMSRVAQRLKVLLVRRPTKEDLKSRGIYREPLFGSTLAMVCANDKARIPIFLSKCFREIESRGLTISGIYRHSGSISKMQKVRIRANQGDYEVSDCDDIHTLTGVVKLFLRELAEPLVPFQFFDRFCDSFKILNQRAKQEAFICLIQELPEENHQTMKELCLHLERVSEYSAENQMTFHNLSIVFGPTLMWLPVHKSSNITSTLILQGQIIEYILQNHQQLFGHSPI